MARFERTTGRYVFLEVDGVEYRVYFEEAGEGIPLLLQHTAGSDGRQWRHLLADEELARHYRMIAYDLPYHGKSVPPEGVSWWQQEYRLTKQFLLAFVTGFARELELDRPVYMGSSIGGHLATDLALHHPDQFRAIIGLEAAISTPGGYQDIWNHPAVNNQFKASVMYGLMSPTSPEAFRHETAWCYSQGGPPTFKGDLYYYSVDHDLSADAEKIDTSRTPLYLLTGEYDWASPPAVTELLAARVKGAKFTKMERLGHFPMSENPSRFREYIAPVLEEIRTASA
jgi:pimeloyl-ACP methyl ester carboxylesterase